MKKKYQFLALATAMPGKLEELKRWYDTQHLPDCLKLDGFISAQRFDVVGKPMGMEVPDFEVLALYEIESDNVEETLGQIPKVARTPAMPFTDAIDLTRSVRFVVTEAAPVQVRKS